MSVSSSSAANPPAKARRAARPAIEARSARFRVPTAVWIVLALVVGMGIGALGMRQRYKAKDVVAAVNGTTIDKETFFHRLELTAGPTVLHQMVGEELQLQFAQKLGVAPTQAEVDARFAQMRNQPHFDQNLAASQQTVEEFKRKIAVQMASAAVLGKGQAVTEEEMRAYYRTQTDPHNPRAQFYTPATATVAVIVSPTEAASQKVLHEMANGMPFAVAARTFSKDRSRAKDGVLPAIVRGRTRLSQVPGMEDAIFNLKIDGQLGPRKFAGSWWIIRCIDKTGAVTQPFAKVKEECRTGAMVVKSLPANGKKTEQSFEEFQKTANIQAFWPEYAAALSVK